MRMTKSRTFLTLTIIGLLAFALTGTFGVLAQEDDGEEDYAVDAHAILMDQSGSRIGTARFVEEEEIGTIAVLISVTGLEPGFHSFGLTDVGECDIDADPVFGSAGERFDLDDDNEAFRAGDFPPLLVMQNGNASMSFRTDGFVLDDIMDDDGTAVVVEAGFDDMMAPDGQDGEDDAAEGEEGEEGAAEAGDRLVCGVIEEGDAEVMVDEAAEEGDMADEDVTATPAAEEMADEDMTATPSDEEMTDEDMTATPSDEEMADEDATATPTGEAAADEEATTDEDPLVTVEPDEAEDTEGDQATDEDMTAMPEDGATDEAAAGDGAEMTDTPEAPDDENVTE